MLTPPSGSMVHYVGHATAGLTRAGQDVQPLHHADILMRQDMAMHHEASDGVRMKINPKGDGSERRILVDVGLRGRGQKISRLRCCTRNNDGVMPFRYRKRFIVYLSDQVVILMDVERMVRKRTIDHGPLFVIIGDHVGEQWLVGVK